MPATRRWWQVVGASTVGTSHVEQGLPCQDAHGVLCDSSGLLAVAVADGAGSAPRSDDGALAAVDAALRHLERRGRTSVGDDDESSPPCGELRSSEADLADDVRQAVYAARAAVLRAAGEADPRDLATTLTVVVVDGTALVAAQVGDGAVVLQRPNGFELLGPVEREEFLNETVFLTSSGWEDELRLDTLALPEEGSGLLGIAVMTDGLQLLALDLISGEPYGGFFGPLLEWTARPESSDEELAEFLSSDRVCARTDDDKTLVLAVVGPDDRAP